MDRNKIVLLKQHGLNYSVGKIGQHIDLRIVGNIYNQNIQFILYNRNSLIHMNHYVYSNNMEELLQTFMKQCNEVLRQVYEMFNKQCGEMND